MFQLTQHGLSSGPQETGAMPGAEHISFVKGAQGNSGPGACVFGMVGVDRSGSACEGSGGRATPRQSKHLTIGNGQPAYRRIKGTACTGAQALVEGFISGLELLRATPPGVPEQLLQSFRIESVFTDAQTHEAQTQGRFGQCRVDPQSRLQIRLRPRDIASRQPLDP